ncbi:hypothetical protein [Parasitella parasitica]|uniref:ER lumen protein-retaining receptor n=1 Tax=Parasitella parasitica TaxID=35722 RepID=A0A0B7N7Q7_9FUNG|nr:hypothetical protein [Parasitella parasitica]
MVFLTRYLDLFVKRLSIYNTVMKIFFITSSLYILYLMRFKYKATYDSGLDLFKVEYLLVGAAILGVSTTYVYTVIEILWSFSIWLESVAILPQLFMLQRTGEAETITTHYLFALGAYRGLYLLNWVYRYIDEGHTDWIAWVAGFIQTALYSDFFYIYYVKVIKQGQKFELPSVHPFSTKPALSQDYQNLIHELNQQVKQRNPEDTLQFCFDFFLQKLLQERSQNRLHQPTISNHEMCGINPYSHEQETHAIPPHSAIHEADEDEDMVSDNLPNFQKNTNLRNRRVSVSAESLQPTQKLQKKKVPKPQAEIDMITNSLQCHFLYKTLEEDQRQDVIDSMEEKRFRQGDTVIEQGAVGDFFYIVSSGTLDCFVDDKLVTRYERGGNFGELALMYNAPRAATIKATSDVVLWALDRVSFRSILMDHNSKKRLMHEEFLKGVLLFQSLELSEIHKIADALEPISFHDKQVVLKQGDAGENFYLIERGHALFYKTENGGQPQLVNEMKQGDYFGGKCALALLTDKPRAATVVAKGDLKCVTLGKAAFTRLLGPVMDILKRNSVNYHAILQKARS